MFGLLLSASMMFIRGIYQILGNNEKLFSDGMFSGIAGLGHIILAVGLIRFMLRIISDLKIVKNNK